MQLAKYALILLFYFIANYNYLCVSKVIAMARFINLNFWVNE